MVIAEYTSAAAPFFACIEEFVGFTGGGSSPLRTETRVVSSPPLPSRLLSRRMSSRRIAGSRAMIPAKVSAVAAQQSPVEARRIADYILYRYANDLIERTVDSFVVSNDAKLWQRVFEIYYGTYDAANPWHQTLADTLWQRHRDYNAGSVAPLRSIRRSAAL
jgi:hypothetical protein